MIGKSNFDLINVYSEATLNLRTAITLFLTSLLLSTVGSQAFGQKVIQNRGLARVTTQRKASHSGQTRFANNFPGADLGQKINAADRDLGKALGIIRVQKGGIISTQVIISHGHTLTLGRGTYVLKTELSEEGAFLLQSGTRVTGSGWDTVIVEPNQIGWTVFQSYEDIRTPPAGSSVDSNIRITNLQIKGANPAVEGGMRQTIHLGNCHQCSVEHVWLNGTGVIGVQAGGNSFKGNFADSVTIKNNLFTQVAAQAAAIVNGRNVAIVGNTFKDSGRKGAQHATAIDIEPNAPSDIAQSIEISDNLIDSRSSGFLHGNGIVVQNGAETSNFGPVVVKHNTIIGGALTPDESGNIGNAILIINHTQDVTVIDNTIQRVSYSGIRLQATTRNYVARNKLISTGAGGLLSRGLRASQSDLSILGLKRAMRTMIDENSSFEIIDTTESKVFDNVITIDPKSPKANSVIKESGTSQNNLYKGNTDGQNPLLPEMKKH